jgi:D-alanyl-D-alanine carboxypeptidase
MQTVSRQLRFDQIVAAWFIAIALLLEGSVLAVPAESKALLPSLPMADIPVAEAVTPETATPSGITAPRFIAIDVDSASVLVESRSTELQPPASVLKLLTAITALDFYQLDDVIVIDQADVEPRFETFNDLKLQVGETVQVRELLA